MPGADDGPEAADLEPDERHCGDAKLDTDLLGHDREELDRVRLERHGARDPLGEGAHLQRRGRLVEHAVGGAEQGRVGLGRLGPAQEEEERDGERDPAAEHEERCDEGRRTRDEAQAPGAPAGLGGGDDASVAAVSGGEDGRPVGDRDTGADGLVDERLGGEHGHDDAPEGIAALARRAAGKIAVEDGREGEDADAPVTFEPHRGGDPGLGRRTRVAQGPRELGCRADVDRVRRRRRGSAQDQRIGEEGVPRGRDPDLLGRLERAPLRGGHARRPADGRDLRPRQCDTRVRREGAVVDHVRVVCRLQSLERKDRGVCALLDGVRRRADVGVRARVGLAPLELPETERKHAGGGEREDGGQVASSRHGSPRLIGLAEPFLSYLPVAIISIPTEGECVR